MSNPEQHVLSTLIDAAVRTKKNYEMAVMWNPRPPAGPDVTWVLAREMNLARLYAEMERAYVDIGRFIVNTPELWPRLDEEEKATQEKCNREK